MKGIVDPSSLVREIVAEQSVAALPLTRKIVDRSGVPFRTVEKSEIALLVAGGYPDALQAGKRILLLSNNEGTFLKRCPATRGYRCCDYQVINTGTGCPMDCTYCILQAYLNTPYLNVFVNRGQLFAELEENLDQPKGQYFRIGTGEFTDSMALDRLTGLSRELVMFFSKRENAVLELKTKSAWIDNLETLDHNGRTIMAWSLNSSAIAQREERYTASLDQRLKAAAQCASWGYPLAFHFDPIIHYENCQEDYRNTVRMIFKTVPKSSIRWISLGAFRFVPKLKEIGTRRFPWSKIYYHEFVPGIDTKQRYFRTLRVSLYRMLYDEICRFCDPETCIYFCMESDEVWSDVMGFTPDMKGGLPAMLDRAAQR